MRSSALVYFLIVFAWTWFFWTASALLNPGVDPGSSPLFLIGGAGPFLVAVALTHLRDDAPTRRSYWRRTFDPRVIPFRWWIPALFLHPAIVAVSFAADSALGGAMPPVGGNIHTASAWAGLLFFTFWFGPLPEEMGWRGFALDRLQSRLSALNASLVLGSVWALWHVPLFFIPGTFQQELHLGSLRSLIFLFSMVPLSVLITWVYNNSGRSILSAVFVHYTGNLCGALLPKTDRVAALEALFLALAAAIVVGRWGSQRLTGRAAGSLGST